MNKKQLMQDLIKAAYAEAEMQPEQKTAMDGVFGIGVTYGVVVTLDAWSKDHDAQQAEIERLKAQIEQVDTVQNGWMGCNPKSVEIKTFKPAEPDWASAPKEATHFYKRDGAWLHIDKNGDLYCFCEKSGWLNDPYLRDLIDMQSTIPCPTCNTEQQ